MDEYVNKKNNSTIIGENYLQTREWTPEESKSFKNDKGETEEVSGGIKKNAKASIFNRYSIFYFNSKTNGSAEHEKYFEAKNRRELDELEFKTERNPTASNIVNWSKAGGRNALDYDWPDFLWCSNYGMVPNNYMLTLRRFPSPVMDDLTDPQKNPVPDIGRLISWVDNENNKWENVGLSWSHGFEWKPLDSEFQDINETDQGGNESKAIGGLAESMVKASDSKFTKASLENPNAHAVNPYQNRNATWGDVDVIKSTIIREKGLKFDQGFTLKFTYDLKSIDGVNSKIAIMDLLSNILICTSNKGQFWGGEIRYSSRHPRRIKPFGDVSKLEKGDFGGYIKTLTDGLMGRINSLTGGKGLNSIDGVMSALGNIGSNMIGQYVGGKLDDMGRKEIVGLNSLLTGEDTGEWHVMVGNPINPIISVGNLILDSTDIQIHGALGYDDFPNKITVTCKLKPARPRDRIDIMNMFHKNARMYLSELPFTNKYTGNVENGGRNGGNITSGANKNAQFNEFISKVEKAPDENYIKQKFPNHFNTQNSENILNESIKGTL